MSAAATLRILTLNVWMDCRLGVAEIAAAIRACGPDVVGLQECTQHTAELGRLLGFNHLQQRDGQAVLTRHDITGTTPNRYGVYLRIEDGRPVVVFNTHLHYMPYQPYQLMHIPYGTGAFIDSEAEAVREAETARGGDVDAVLADVAAVEGMPTFLVGDFNEPSYLDWTVDAVRAGRHPVKVSWPATRRLAAAGFTDAYRTVYPNEMTHPGFTWTPLTRADDPKDHHDRIDLVLYRGEGVKVNAVDVVGECADNASIVVAPYPTDHRGVVGTFEI